MSTVDLIYEKAKGLPPLLQTEALHYVVFLQTRNQADAEAAEWGRFSTQQLEKYYAPADAIYDEE
jgi:hypothetical protein